MRSDDAGVWTDILVELSAFFFFDVFLFPIDTAGVRLKIPKSCENGLEITGLDKDRSEFAETPDSVHNGARTVL